MPENVLMGQLHLSKACWKLWLSDDQPHSDYNGQWQRALCILAVLQSSQPNPQRNEKTYAIKQIKICAEYRDMLPRPRLDLSGTPGLRLIGLGSMSRYSAQILICIINVRAFGPRTHYRVGGLAGNVMRAWVSHSLVNHWICNFKASLVLC